jgi:hypothetical protein
MPMPHQRARCRRIGFSLCLALLSVVATCGDDPREPLDGGRPIDLDRHPETEPLGINQPCLRREKRGWHHSTGHCQAMLPPQRMSGVWTTGFELSSFFPGDTTIPAPNDWRSGTVYIELNEDRVYRVADAKRPDQGYHAYLVTFVGRRTRDPELVDCQGMSNHTVVVYRMESARYLGAMAEMDGPTYSNELRARPVTVTQRHGGRLGELEREAVERCTKRRAEQGVGSEETP